MRTLMEFERPCFGLVQSVGQGEFAALPLWMRNLGVGGAVAAAVGRLCSRVFVVSSACSCVRACVRVCVCVSGASLARDAPESVTAAVPSRPALLAPVAELGMPSDAPKWLAGWLVGRARSRGTKVADGVGTIVGTLDRPGVVCFLVFK